MGRATTNDNKERICIYVDKRVLAHFRHVAEQTETPYSLLLNKALVEQYEALPDEEKYHNR